MLRGGVLAVGLHGDVEAGLGYVEAGIEAVRAGWMVTRILGSEGEKVCYQASSDCV